MPRGNNRPLIRDTKFLGYKYTEKEKKEMAAALESFKLKNNCCSCKSQIKSWKRRRKRNGRKLFKRK